MDKQHCCVYNFFIFSIKFCSHALNDFIFIFIFIFYVFNLKFVSDESTFEEWTTLTSTSPMTTPRPGRSINIVLTRVHNPLYIPIKGWHGQTDESECPSILTNIYKDDLNHRPRIKMTLDTFNTRTTLGIVPDTPPLGSLKNNLHKRN